MSQKDKFPKIVKANAKLNSDIEVIVNEAIRDNVLFHGTREREGEDCVTVINQICKNNLDIEGDTCIKTAFRLGKKREVNSNAENASNVNNIDSTIRPILVKFEDRQKCNGVSKGRFKLKWSLYPNSVVDKRR